jgi:translation initiation factor 4G
MNQAMPMQTPPQFNNGYYPNHNMGPQVNHPSITNHIAEFFKHNRGGRGRRLTNEKSSNGQRPQQQSQRELFGHSYMSQQPMPVEHESLGRSDVRFGTSPPEHPRPGHIRHRMPLSMPKPLELLECGNSASDLSVLPPTPSPPNSPSLQTFFPIKPFPKLDVTRIQQIDISPESGGFEKYLMNAQQNYPGYPPQYDSRMGMPMQGAPYMYPQMNYMQPMNGPPQQSPQPGYQQPYMQGQYVPQAQPMSRTSSQMSEQRPASSMGQVQTPLLTPAATHTHTPQPKAAPPAAQQFTRPTRKSAAIVIKKPDGEALDVESLKTPASPAPRDRTRTPPVIASNPTPPPKSSTPQHVRTDSAAIKSQEQIRLEVMEKVKKAAEAEKAAETQATTDAAAKAAAEAKALEEAKEKEEADAAAAKAKEEAEAKAAADKAKQEEEEELERQIREIEEAEAAEEKRQEELLKKRAADKAITDAANAEKRKAEAEENDRKLKEAEREMERLEDERERKRALAEAKESGSKPEVDVGGKKVSEEKNAPATPNTIASKLSNLSLGTDSGASTPASGDSMGPPPKITASEKHSKKPAALTLAPLNTKPVEPPQPSAALQSLKSARFLTVLNSDLYPPNISSPNPALNSAVTAKGKSFKYDKEFLLQFQKVFTEKPSIEFESQIKALIGDGDGGSARSTARTPSGMGPRNSNRNPPGQFPSMGSFGVTGVGGKTLPPGTTSAERFAISTGAMTRPAINPMNSFRGPGGSFPAGNSMTRSPSSSTMNSLQSPRQHSRSQRGGGGSKNYQGSSAKQDAQKMPLTQNMELKPIQVTASGWKPLSLTQNSSATGAAGPAPGASGSGHMPPDMVQRKVKAALNKMTPEKFDKISDQVLAIAAQSKDEADGRTLRQVIQLTFEKATDEAHWASMYAKFCKRTLETMSPDIKDESILDRNGNIVSGGNLFRKYLLNRCQEEFERGWKMALPEKPEGERGEEKSEEAAMLSDEYYIAAAAKRRGLGLVQFIGELYKLGMLTERIMHECVKKLVDYTGIPDEAEIESLTKLLKTIGANLDGTEKGKPMMDVYFARIQGMIDTPDLPSRLKFMLMDIIDLRKARWQSKEANKGPKTLEEVRAEASLYLITLILAY